MVGAAFAGVFAKLVAPRISDAFWSGVYVLFGWLAVLALSLLWLQRRPLL